MQYVGRFVSSVYNTITPNINAATLSGAIDVIVVERQIEREVDEDDDDQASTTKNADVAGYSIDDASAASSIKSPAPSIASSSSRPASVDRSVTKRKRKRREVSTELASTPFHVRFGKMSVLRPAERKVTLHLNNSPDPLPFAMKIGEAGEAFFVVELDGEDADQGIPDELVTSPILSATTSPDMQASKAAASEAQGGVDDVALADHKGPHKLIAEDYVEPLDLGVAQSPASHQASSKTTLSDTATVQSGGTLASQDTANTSPNSRPSTAENAPDHDVEIAKENEGSEHENTENSTFLENVGNAASKASGVLGAAGAAMMPSLGGGRNTKLEKLTKRNSLRDKASGVRSTGADIGESKSAHRLETFEHSKTKERMQEQDDDHPPDDIKDAQNETERLEIKLRDRTRRLVDETIEARRERELEEQASGSTDAPITKDGNQEQAEERYPAPFGGDGSSRHTKAYATTQPDHEDYLAGRKVKPVRSGLPGVQAVEPAQVDPRTIERRLKEWRETHPEKQAEKSSTSQDGSHGSAPTKKYHLDGSAIPTIKASHKEDLQYMLDMDGYKMTADGEDLAFAEGSRLESEIPISKSHDAQLTEYGVRSNEMENIAKEPSAAGGHSVDGSEIQSQLQASVDSSQKTTLSATLDELDANLASNSSDEPSAYPTSADQLNLSRDLVRLMRNRHRLQIENAEERRVTNSISASDQKCPRRSQFHDMSLSDTEAGEHEDEVSSDSRADISQMKQAQKTISRGQSHQRAISLATPSHGVADDLEGPLVRDDAELGLASSSGLEWTWSEKRRGPGRRTRVLSNADVPDDGAFETAENEVGRLTCNLRDPYEFQLELGDTCHTFSLSLCNLDALQDEGGAQHDESENNERMHSIVERFEDNKISYQRFVEDDNVVNDERLVIRYNDRYLTWENASTVLATLSLYRKTFGGSAVEAPIAATGANPPVQEGSVWRRWWYRNRVDTSRMQPSAEGGPSAAPLERASTDSVIDAAAAQRARDETLGSKDSKGNDESERKSKPPKVYAKTLRLTSEQLKSLNLRKGANTITFSVTSSYSGVATCTARIFLWDSTHQVVVSDIDGTITKSDALGHVFTMIGRDWTHSGVAKLYTDIARNGYRIMYLTSRAIGQADTTRDYLRGITQSNFKLPDGPVIMSPDRLMASLHREVILRKPEVFKMACLRDIARLFGSDPRQAPNETKEDWPAVQQTSLQAANGPGAGMRQSPGEGAATNFGSAGKQSQSAAPSTSPFYAGFGNRITDALSYRSVNIPSSRIFTIDSNGEVKMELLELAGYKSSYIHMTDLVDQMFPPISLEVKKRDAGKPEFNDFNYWRSEIGEFELPDDEELTSAHLGSSPTSPALSARSVRTVKSNSSLRSQSSSMRKGNDGEEKKSNTAEEGSIPSQGSTSRLSRFGLGKLGLSRRGSAQTIAEPPSGSSPLDKNSSEGGQAQNQIQNAKRAETSAGFSEGPTAEAARRMSPPSSPSSSYGAGVSSWTANWRRRGTSPPGEEGHPAPRASSPLMGPVITADPDDIDEQDEDSGELREDDDVSSFDGDDNDADDVEENGEPRSGKGRGDPRLDGSVGSNGNDDVLDDDDPLLATGEIRFEWRG